MTKTTHKLLSLLCAAALLLTLLPAAAIPSLASGTVVEEGICGENVTWTLTADGVLTISGTGEMEDFDYYGPWKSNRYKVTSVIVEDGVTSIGKFSFHECDALTSILLPDSITRIGEYAFMHCHNLSSITLPDSLTSIGTYAFYDCRALSSVRIPDGVTVLESRTFDSCYALSSVSLGAGLTSIESLAFYSCSALEYIDLPDGLTHIGYQAFALCSRLKEITLPDSVTAVERAAFHDCRELVRADLGDGLTTLSSELFTDCTSLTEIIFPSGLTTIGWTAFKGCISLTSVTLPDSLNSIERNAFSGCINLSSLELGSGISVIGAAAFSGCESLTELTIPDNVVELSKSAFSDCASLRKVSIGCGVTTIGNEVFRNCDSLMSITIPEDVVSVGDAAFGDCAILSSVIFLGSPTLGSNLFRSSLNPGLVEFQSDAPAFHSLTFSLTAATCRYPVGNTTWSDSILQNYGGEITWEAVTFQPADNSTTTVATVASGACGDHLSWTLNDDGVLTISGSGDMWNYESYRNDQPWAPYSDNITSIVLSDGLTSIGESAFLNLKYISEITVPDSVTHIGYQAFAGCDALISVTLPSGLTEISSSLFEYCPNLTSITIPDGVTHIGNVAFTGCSSLTEIIIPDSVTYIGSHAFSDCSSLASVILPRSLSELHNNAFANCGDLTSITIPAGVTFLGYELFAFCTDLTQVVFLGDAPKFELDIFWDVTATCYYPSNNPTWTETIQQNYSGTITWVPRAVCPHNYIAGEVTPPTCSEQGCTTYVCELCGDSYQGDFVPTNCPSGKFTDVTVTAWYHPYVDFVVERGLMSGTGGNLFEPSRNIDRASFVSILYRMANSPDVSGEHPFTDVKDGAWYSNAILWAYQNDITSGTSATTFSPGATLTRQELVTLLQRFANIMGWKLNAPQNVDLSSFPDGDTVSTWAADSMNWACDMGLISGRSVGGETRLDPTGNAMRSEIASIFARFYTLIES